METVSGYEMTDSATIYNALEKHCQMKASSFYTYAPDRLMSLRCNLKGFNQCYSVTMCEGTINW